MSGENKRTAALLAVLAAVGVLVVLDRAGGGASGEEAEGEGRRARYVTEASLLRQTRAVAELGEEWSSASESARRAWEERRSRMIEAPSAEIAAARLRGLIEQVLLDEGLEMTTSETLPAGASESAASVVGIGLGVSFEARDAAPVYRAVDRIENLSDAAARVEALTLRGPGRLGASGVIQATIRVRSVAHLRGGGRG